MDDILVIGAGPAGSRVAGGLAGQGYRVKVLEQDQQTRERICCTGLVGSRCLERFAIMGETVLRSANSAVFHSPAGKEIRLEKEVAQAYVLNRTSLNRVLAREAEGKGADYVFDCRVTDITRVDGHVTVDALLGRRKLSFDARALVLASGFSPALVGDMGLGRIKDFTVGAQAEVETESLEEVEIYFSRRLAPGFFAWVVPTTSRKARVGLMARERTGQHLKNFLYELYGKGKISSPDADIQYGVVPLRPLERSYGKRIVVVGDAAGQVKPTTGGGIYYGLLCADIAIDVLGGALQCGDLSARRLSRYQKKWKKALGWELRMGYVSRRVYERLSDRKVDELFEVIKAHSLHKLAIDLPGFSFDWHGDILRYVLRHHAVRAAIGVVLMGLVKGTDGDPVGEGGQV